jgi:hypothetical protein
MGSRLCFYLKYKTVIKSPVKYIYGWLINGVYIFQFIMLWNVQRLYGFWLPLWYFQALLYIYVMRSYPVHGEMYSIQHDVIKFISDLRQAGGVFLLTVMFGCMVTDRFMHYHLSLSAINYLFSISNILITNITYYKLSLHIFFKHTEILLKVALKHHQPKPNPFIFTFPMIRSFMKLMISELENTKGVIRIRIDVEHSKA